MTEMHDNDNHTQDEYNESTPSPLMVGGPQVGGLSYIAQNNPYILRFTPATIEDKNIQAYEYTDVKQWLSENFNTWILTEERRPHVHFHMFVDTKKSLEKMKKYIREFIYKYYPQRPKGFGGAQYNLKESEIPLNAIIYCLKQKGRYDWSGFESEEFIQHCQRVSYEKKTNEVQQEITDLEEKFLKGDIQDPYQFATDLSIIYARHDKNINYNNLQNYINSKIIKRSEQLAYTMAKKNLKF